ncbi:hypothetical protein L218DRAFT_988661 [Marasmius fiardii PR-910]|nr:hypothetical protein L218DRAFT_988661 [Marasmius fiardii PR-910]
MSGEAKREHNNSSQKLLPPTVRERFDPVTEEFFNRNWPKLAVEAYNFIEFLQSSSLAGHKLSETKQWIANLEKNPIAFLDCAEWQEGPLDMTDCALMDPDEILAQFGWRVNVGESLDELVERWKAGGSDQFLFLIALVPMEEGRAALGFEFHFDLQDHLLEEKYETLMAYRG